MFTGIIEKVGRLASVEARSGGARLVVTHTPWEAPLVPGESVAVQGACLTVVGCEPGRFVCDLLQETLDKTCLGEKVAGAQLNLERALRADGRFGGHIVSGHVDGTGRVARLDPVGPDWILEIACPDAQADETVVKGSIAIDGVSLTVTAVTGARIAVHLIPFTWTHTSLSELRVGARVNLETDIIGKYVRKALGQGVTDRPGVQMADLVRAGLA